MSFAKRAAAAVAVVLIVGSANLTLGRATPYEHLATTAGEDGWAIYLDAPMVDPAQAADLDPTADSPESVVVKFLASRMRGDMEWQEAIAFDSSQRIIRQLEEWDEWELERFQLRARKPADASTVLIRVFFEISVDGQTDDGEDDFVVVQKDEGWRVVSIPG